MPEVTQTTPGELGTPPVTTGSKPVEQVSATAVPAGEAVIPEPTAKPQTPSEVEQLKAQVAASKTENERKEKEILRLQGISKKSITRDEFLALHKKIDETQDYFAEMMDSFAAQQLGEPEEPKPGRKSHKEELQARRTAQAKNAPANPEAQVFWAYMISQGLTLEDADVKASFQEDRDPREALEFLKAKQDAKFQATVEKKANERAEAIVESKFKALGLASSGAGAPSIAGVDTSHMTPDQKLAKGFEQYKKK